MFPEQISSEVAFRSGFVYCLQTDVVVTQTGRLVVQPGAVVKFIEGQFRTGATGGPTDRSDIIVEGSLDIQGTSDSVAIFTSILDDVSGGDSNEDGANTSPSMFNWGSITTRAKGTINIAHAEFRYASIALQVEDATLIADNIDVRDTNIAILTAANDSPTITNLSVTRVNFGGIVTTGALTKDLTWGIGDAPVIVTQDYSVASNVTLTINPGTVVKFS